MEIHKTIYKTKNKEIKLLRAGRAGLFRKVFALLKDSFTINRKVKNSYEEFIHVRVGLFGFAIYTTDLKEKEKWDELDAKTHDSWLY
jgi:hypothetical protein